MEKQKAATENHDEKQSPSKESLSIKNITSERMLDLEVMNEVKTLGYKNKEMMK